MQARLDAISKNQKTYIAEHPCMRGHEPIRYASTGICVFCNRQRAIDARAKIINKAWGFKERTVMVHDADWEYVQRIVKQTEMARKLQEGKI
jgi:hypothetical protein